MVSNAQVTKQLYQFDHTAAQAGETTGNFRPATRWGSFNSPVTLFAQTSDLGVAPLTPSITVKLQHSADGTVWKDVPSGGITAITTAGTQTGEVGIATQLLPYLRVHVVSTFGTVNGGTRVKVWLSGD